MYLRLHTEYKKEIKLIVLIITSSQHYYREYERQWKKYMNSFPNVKCFFIELRDNINNVIEEKNKIIIPGKESYVPGIFEKTIKSMRYVSKKYKYTHLLRTNACSVWNFPKLFKKLETLPEKKICAGQTMHDKNYTFCQGSGMIFTLDTIFYMINNIQNIKNLYHMPDDILLSLLAKKYTQKYEELERHDFKPKSFNKTNIYILDTYYHIRNRHNEDRMIDAKNMAYIIKYWYNK